MATRGDTQINSFVGGLITEVSPLSYPANTSLDEINFKLKRDGTRERRLGLDIEAGGTFYTSELSAIQMASAKQRFFKWSSPSGYTDVEIGIIQIGNSLWFVDLYSAAPSSNLLNGGNKIQYAVDHESVFDFSLINNNVILVSGNLHAPHLLSYDRDSDTVSSATANLNIRDIYGVEDGIELAGRPNTLSNNHKYNLRNQGWNERIVTTCSPTTDVLECTFEVAHLYPSNSDTWTLGKVDDVSSADVDKYDPEVFLKNSFDLGRAARGHFVISLYNRGGSRGAVSGVSVELADRELGRISTVASYAGRAFYSGIDSKVVGGDKYSPKLSGSVLFSQVADREENLIKCYQESDPTSPENSDIIDTDGGIIQIPGASNIVKLMPIKETLFVFSENGIWTIKGDDGGFSATTFQVSKITSIGVFSRESIVDANGTIVFWAENGIYKLSPDQFGTSWEATNITLTTIQSIYDTFPTIIKKNSRGFFDASSNSVRWIYASDDAKIVGQPIDIQPVIETPSVGVVGTLESITNNNTPAVGKLSSTRALVIYRRSSGSAIYGKVVTINPDDLSVTFGAEQNLSTVSAGGSHTLTYISEDKLLLASQESSSLVCRVVNVSSDVVSLGAKATLNAETSTSVNSRIRVAMIGTTKAVASFYSNSGGKAAIQVLEIDSSDVITYGSVYRNNNLASNNSPSVVMLTPTSGLMLASTTSSVGVAHFSLSGTVATLTASSGTFLTAAQATGSTTLTSGSIVALSSSTAVVSGLYTNLTGLVSVPVSFIVTETGGTVTGGSILIDGTTSVTKLTSYIMGTKSITLSRDNQSGSIYIPRVSSATLTNPQTDLFALDFEAREVVGNPEGAAISSTILVSSWEGDSSNIEVGAVRV